MVVMITPASLGDPRIVALLETHFDVMHATSPEDSCHVLAIEEISTKRLSLWAAWDDHDRERLLGVGGLLELDPRHGEIKSMHTVEALRGRGTGTAILQFIMGAARARGYDRLSLETGASDDFSAARRLYEAHGFLECPPFGSYTIDPHSVFMTLHLN